MTKNLLEKIINNYVSRWMVLFLDIYLISNAFVLAYLIRFNFNLTFDINAFYIQIPVVIITGLISFLIIGSYKGIVRHTSFHDALNISLASLLVLIILVTIVLINQSFAFVPEFTIPISILIIHFLLNGFVLISSRFLIKGLYYLLTKKQKFNRQGMIYGAGEAGLLTYSLLNDSPKNPIKVVGFIDDNKRKIGKQIHGLKVYDSKYIDQEFVQTQNIDEIILSIQVLSPKRIIEIIGNLSKLDVEVKIVPTTKNWIDGDFKIQQIKNIRIEDLLGRNALEIDNPILKKNFTKKVVLITGAAGSIGSEISRQIIKYQCINLILIDQSESDLYDLQQYFNQKKIYNVKAIVADIRNKKRMKAIFKLYQPNLIFHAAAYKHVPFMEENPYEAVAVNICGTKIIADLALEFGVHEFVMISTDKAVNPTNVMGASKRIAEKYIQCLQKFKKTKFTTTRFGNVLGSNGSVIPLFQSQIENGGPITLTHKEITRYFMTIPEACQLVLEAGCMGNGGEVYVFDMGESIKIFDLAINMIHLSGLKYPEDIDIELIGLRPGEKIFEELLATDENTVKTYHEKIMIAKAEPIDVEFTKQQVIDLCLIHTELNSFKTVSKMKEIVPEFISNNSKYEQLD